MVDATGAVLIGGGVVVLLLLAIATRQRGGDDDPSSGSDDTSPSLHKMSADRIGFVQENVAMVKNSSSTIMFFPDAVIPEFVDGWNLRPLNEPLATYTQDRIIELDGVIFDRELVDEAIAHLPAAARQGALETATLWVPTDEPTPLVIRFEGAPEELTRLLGDDGSSGSDTVACGCAITPRVQD
jgi:hypothetical protein